jgi:hypothetical protein
MLLLRTGIPGLAARAFAHILAGSGSRLVLALLIVSVAGMLLWVVLASLGRAATLPAIVESLRRRAALASREYRRDLLDDAAASEPLAAVRPVSSTAGSYSAGKARSSFPTILGLNVLRSFLFFIAVLAAIACLFVASQFTSPDHPHPLFASFTALILLATVFFFAGTLNWFLSVAALFAVRGPSNSFDALHSAVAFCRERFAAVSAVGFWFGLAHLTFFVIATSVVGFPLSLAGTIPPGFVLLAVVLITAAYFAIADFLYIGRLAAYAAILEAPVLPVPRLGTLPIPSHVDWPISSTSSASQAPTTTAVDPDDLILSDGSVQEVPVREIQAIDQDEAILSDQPQQGSPTPGPNPPATSD